jgi:hypothetical protein
MWSNLIGLALCMFLLVLWLGARREDREAVQRDCHHRWTLDSLYGEGEMWFRRCTRCGKQEPVPDPKRTPPRLHDERARIASRRRMHK